MLPLDGQYYLQTTQYFSGCAIYLKEVLIPSIILSNLSILPTNLQYYCVTSNIVQYYSPSREGLKDKNWLVRRRGVAGRVPAFQLGWTSSIFGGVRNFNFYSETGYVFFVFCPVFSLAVNLTLWWPDFQGGPTLCIRLVFWSCCFPFKHLTHGY